MLRTTIILTLILHLSGSAAAGVIAEVSDDGTDLFFQWTGSFDLGNLTGDADTNPGVIVSGSSGAIWTLDGSNFRSTFSGTSTGNDPIIAPLGAYVATALGGTGFGFNGLNVYWDDSFGASPGVINPTGSWKLSNYTVASVFGSSLDSGPVALWTLTSTGDTISVGLATSTAVPEPSSLALFAMGLCGTGLVCRRRLRTTAGTRC